MAQSSGPISQGTTAERQLTDVLWRDAFGDESGVLADYDGTAYAINISGADVAQVGSSTQNSVARVAGFAHRIPTGSPEAISVPPAVGSARNDILALRYDPAYTGLPGPVRLVRVAGSSSSLPTYDDAPPGIEDLPLWSVTRQPGQALSQATVKRLFPRIAPSMQLDTAAPLPLSSPLGTVIRQGSATYRRQLDNASNPVWVTDGSSKLTSIIWPNLQRDGTNNIPTSTITASLNGAPYRLVAIGSLTAMLAGSGTPELQLFVEGSIVDKHFFRGVGGSPQLHSGKVMRSIDITNGRSVAVSARIDIPFGVSATTYADSVHSWLSVEAIAL